MKEKTKMALQQRHVFEQMEKGQQYTLEQMAQQNQYNIEAFNRENEYNSPSQQMKRAAAAGLNPMFGLGQQAADQNSAVSGSAPSGSAPSGGPDTDLQRIQNIFGLAGQAAQGVSELTTAFANKKNAQTNETQMAYDAEVKAASAQKMRQEARSLQIENDVKAIHFKDRYEKEINEIGKRAEFIGKQSENYFAQSNAIINELLSRRELNDENAKVLRDTLPKILQNYDETWSYQKRIAATGEFEAREKVRHNRAQEGIEIRKNEISALLAKSQISLQDAQKYAANMSAFSDEIDNNLKEWAYHKGISKRAVRWAADKVGVEMLKEFDEYKKGHPQAVLADYLMKEYNTGNIAADVVLWLERYYK